MLVQNNIVRCPRHHPSNCGLQSKPRMGLMAGLITSLIYFMMSNMSITFLLLFVMTLASLVYTVIDHCIMSITAKFSFSLMRLNAYLVEQEAFEKCWAHSPLRDAALPFTRFRYYRTPPAHRCPQQHQQRQQ